MKTFLTVLFTGAMLSSAAFSSDGDPYREERFKAKFGRYTAIEEARRAALVQQTRTSAKECAKHECCSHKGMTHQTPKAVSNGNVAFAEAWAQAKFGRSLRRTGTVVQTATVEQPAVSMCDDPKCCE